MFTRQLYDVGAYNTEVDQSIKPGQYYLMSEATHRGVDTCFQEIPEMHSANKQLRISDKNDMISMESDLYNLFRKSSKDPVQKYPFVNPKYNDPPKIIPVCSNKKDDFNIIYPKLENSQFNRGKSIHIPRFESLCLNPQRTDRIRSNNVIGLNTRLYNRDTYHERHPLVTNKTNAYENLNYRLLQTKIGKQNPRCSICL